TAATCSACHSLDYVTTQPRGKGAQFWQDSVGKMIKVYGAPIEPADAERIAAYLAATYGRKEAAGPS
ncbi:sulfite:cytochrome C oxidoreductase subunit B, partial [Sphingomonas sp. BHC-A]